VLALILLINLIGATMSNTISFTKYFAMFAIVLSVFFTLPTHDVFATGANRNTDTAAVNKNAISDILCNAVDLISGGIGKSIAILIIISLAIALFLGKVSWGMAIAVAVGMGILFGAEGMITVISGGGASPCAK